ncbi:MAG TPA: thioredoxin family protein [Chitinophagaceae bacterium]|nr:thioredoxin family protein [Chitinophagaceae bacterium]
MKKFSILIAIMLMASAVSLAQNQYQVLEERPNEKSLKGILSREVITGDTTFKWYADAQKIYTPYAAAVEALQKNKDSVQLLVFMGTWCEDSHFVIPRLYKLTDAAGFPDNRISLIGVDRNKKTLSHLCEALNVINVPTIIVMKNGKELGRVVEYGKYGMFDKELGEIVNTATTH